MILSRATFGEVEFNRPTRVKGGRNGTGLFDGIAPPHFSSGTPQDRVW